MIGRRLHASDDELGGVQPGDYWKASDRNPSQPKGYWIVALPVPAIDIGDGETMPILGTLNPSKHSIVEHEDGTITVSPSILSTRPDGTEVYHGFLEAGVWRSC